MKIEELLAKIDGMDATAKAKAISNYMAANNRKRTVEDARRETRNKCFKNCKKLTKAQQESYLYEFLEANSEYIANWFLRKHPEICNTK